MKRVLITGASSGIGAAAAGLFLERGWHVVMVSRNKNRVLYDNFKELFKENVSFIEADVSRNDSVKQLYIEVTKDNSKIDCVINNAGIIVHGRLDETSEKDWDDVFATDVKSIYLTSKYFIPGMIKQGGGTIINTASISGINADYNMPVYNAAKGAVVNLTRAMALDYGEYNIRVNSVCPGATDTPMLRKGSGNIDDYAAVNPLKRICEPIEVAKAMYFLASEESSYCNGVNLPVTGGLEVHTGQPKK